MVYRLVNINGTIVVPTKKSGNFDTIPLVFPKNYRQNDVFSLLLALCLFPFLFRARKSLYAWPNI
jgi:hypothetical protein